MDPFDASPKTYDGTASPEHSITIPLIAAAPVTRSHLSLMTQFTLEKAMKAQAAMMKDYKEAMREFDQLQDDITKGKITDIKDVANRIRMIESESTTCVMCNHSMALHDGIPACSVTANHRAHYHCIAAKLVHACIFFRARGFTALEACHQGELEFWFTCPKSCEHEHCVLNSLVYPSLTLRGRVFFYYMNCGLTPLAGMSLKWVETVPSAGEVDVAPACHIIKNLVNIYVLNPASSYGTNNGEARNEIPTHFPGTKLLLKNVLLKPMHLGADQEDLAASESDEELKGGKDDEYKTPRNRHARAMVPEAPEKDKKGKGKTLRRSVRRKLELDFKGL
jgi:hypothetical protein